MSSTDAAPIEQTAGCPWRRAERPASGSPLPLAPDEVVPGRPFADPQRSAGDLTALNTMRATLRSLLKEPRRLPERPPPLLLYPQTPGQRRQRVILLDPQALTSNAEVTAVGFFGQIRATADRALLDALDTELIAEFLRYPALLSYSSLELSDGVWGNLVLLRHAEGLAHWSSGSKHAYVAYHVAPASYDSIRLHTVALSGGLLSTEPLRIRCTKYYDFGHEPVWRAIREL